MTSSNRSLLLKGTAIVVLLVLYAFTKRSGLSESQLRRLYQEFAFTKLPVNDLPSLRPKSIRQVHPQYRHISAWLSSVGAANALTDFDGDLLPNDLVCVDPRFDKVWIQPAPGTESSHHSYGRVIIEPAALYYDPATMAPMGALPNDFNEDGRMDVLVYYWGRTPVIFYGVADGFRERELVHVTGKYFSNAGTLADFDGDGHIDIMIGNYFPDDASVLDAGASDEDQLMQHSMSRADNGARNRIFLWKSSDGTDARFEEAVNWDAGIDNPFDWTLALGAADINGDMLPEVYIANDFAADKLLLNMSSPGQIKFRQLKGKRSITTIPSSVVGRDSFKGMGVCFADVDGDALLDIYVSNISESFSLFESHFCFINNGAFEGMKEGWAPYTNKSESLGLSRSFWSWDSKIADFNNDGIPEAIQATGFVKGKVNRWPELQELAMGNDELLRYAKAWPDFREGCDLSGNSHIPFFVLTENGKYHDIADNVNLGDVQITRGLAVADVEHDGDLDFAAANQWEASHLYRNDASNSRSFIGLTLLHAVDEKLNSKDVLTDVVCAARYAIGAFASLSFPDGRTMTGFVDGGNGHSGKNASEVFFGLGDHPVNEEITVELRWRMHGGRVRTSRVKLLPGWHRVILPF